MTLRTARVARATLLAVLACLPVAAQEAVATEALRYLAGLVERARWDEAVREGEAFLRRHGNDEQAPLARLYLGEALFASGRTEDALGHFETLAALEGFGSRDEARLRFAQCALEHGRAADAVFALDRIVSPTLRADARRLAARASYLAGDLDGAARRYGELAEDDDRATRAEAELGLAWIAFDRRRWADVRRHADRALGGPADPGRVREARLLAAEAALAAGDADGALELVEPLGVGDPSLRLLRGRAHAATGRLERAEAELAAAREGADDATRTRVDRELGVVLCRAGRPAEAVAHLRRANDPWWLARAQLDAGDARAALATLERAGDDERFAHLRGEVLTALGRTDEAERAFRSAGTAEGLYAALFTAYEADRADQVLAFAEQLAERFADDPRTAEARFLAGEVLFRAERWDEAERRFAAACDARDPALAKRALTRRLWALDALGRNREVVALGRAHVADPEVALLVGLALRATDDRPGAVEAWEAGLRADPDGPRALELAYHVGLEAEDERAVEALGAVAASDASFAPDALLALASREEAAGRGPRARRAYERFLERHAGHALEHEARYGLGWRLYEDGDRERALSVLAPVVEASGAELAVPANELAFWCALPLGRWDDVERAFRRVVADSAEPVVLDALRAFCEDATRAERSPLARRATELVARKGGALAVGAHVERAWLELGQGQLDAARSSLAAAGGERRADVAEVAYALGEACLAAERWDLAADAFARAERSGGPRADEARFQRAFLALRAGDAKACLATLEELLAPGRSPEPPPELSAECLALAVRAAGDLEDHTAVLRHAATFQARHRRHAHLVQVLLARGRAEHATGAFAAAAETLADVVRAERAGPRFAAAELLRGLSLLELGRHRDAGAALGRALEVGGGDAHVARARHGLARLDELAGDAEDALAAHLKVAILHAHEPSVTASLLAAARLLEADGDTEGARDRWRELLERFPASPRAAEARAALSRLDTPR